MMFDIKIGTLFSVTKAEGAIPMLVKEGFESFELEISRGMTEEELKGYASRVLPLLGESVVSALAFYGNPLANDDDLETLKVAIRSCKYFGCRVVGCFAGAIEGKSVPESIPVFKERFTPVAALAEECGVKIGFENCDMSGTYEKPRNIAFCPEAWDLIFAAVDSPNLGLEWEPAHQLCALLDPIANLRKYAKKVVHLHGKDATVAWDVIRDHGIRGAVPYCWNRTPGFGDTNWADVFTILLQNGFEGACDIEGYHDPVHYDDMEWTAQKTALEYLKRCRGGTEYFFGPAEIRGYQGKRK